MGPPTRAEPNARGYRDEYTCAFLAKCRIPDSDSTLAPLLILAAAVLFGPWSGLCLAAINAWRMGRRARVRWYAILDVAGTGLVPVLIGAVAFDWLSTPVGQERVLSVIGGFKRMMWLYGGLNLVVRLLARSDVQAVQLGGQSGATPAGHQVLGGFISFSCGTGVVVGAALAIAVAGSGLLVAPTTMGRVAHPARRLPDDRVLVAGGSAGPSLAPADASAFGYDSPRDRWLSAQPITTGRAPPRPDQRKPSKVSPDIRRLSAIRTDNGARWHRPEFVLVWGRPRQVGVGRGGSCGPGTPSRSTGPRSRAWTALNRSLSPPPERVTTGGHGHRAGPHRRSGAGGLL